MSISVSTAVATAIFPFSINSVTFLSMLTDVIRQLSRVSSLISYVQPGHGTQVIKEQVP